MIEIKNRWTGDVICSGKTLQLAVETNRADLSGADLSRADLYKADLSGADLSGANLSRANLYKADLSGADLSRADLYKADLSGADLSWANLSGANLSGADLSGADLSGANLYKADLSWANLYKADLSGAGIAWQSHDLIAEILKRAAGDDVAKMKVAGYILICRDKCWQHFVGLRDPLTGWALGVLREWITDDNSPPAEVKAWLTHEPVTHDADSGSGTD